MKFHRIPVGLFSTNCVMIEDEATREAAIVDPGGDAQVIQGRVEALKLKPGRIVLTHGHIDHCIDASGLAKHYGIPIAMHADDLPMYQNLPRQVAALLGAEAVRRMTFDATVEPALLLKQGDRVSVGKGEAEVLHLPGHSPGGIGLLFRGQPHVLVCGDTIFRDGVGRTDLWGGDWQVLMRTIRERILTLPADTRLITGHGAETTVGREKGNFDSYV